MSAVSEEIGLLIAFMEEMPFLEHGQMCWPRNKAMIMINGILSDI